MTMTSFIQDKFEFYSLLINEPLIVVSCTISWSKSCQKIEPLIAQLAEDYGDVIRVFTLDLDRHRILAYSFGVTSFPAVMLFKKGELVATLVGFQTYEKFSDEVRAYLL